jgi:hypothetical protein
VNLEKQAAEEGKIEQAKAEQLAKEFSLRPHFKLAKRASPYILTDESSVAITSGFSLLIIVFG